MSCFFRKKLKAEMFPIVNINFVGLKIVKFLTIFN